MKTITLGIILLGLVFNSAITQDLSLFELKAHYTLINSSEDAQGNFDTIQLLNAPYSGLEGIYNFGGYFYNARGEDSTYIETPRIPNLYDTTFAVELEFKLDSIDSGGYRPVIIVGRSWRYLGFAIKNQKFVYVFNNLEYEINNITPVINQWYTLTIVYDASTSTAYYYIDGNLEATHIDPLVRDDTDDRLSNSNGGNGTAFRGFWRNLKVYSSETIYSSISSTSAEMGVINYPNPFSNELYFEIRTGVEAFIELFDMEGRQQFRSPLKAQINLSHLPSAIYTLKVQDDKGRIYVDRLVKQ